MIKLKFLAKAWETGNSTVLTIPYEYVDCGTIIKDKTYKVTVEEVEL